MEYRARGPYIRKPVDLKTIGGRIKAVRVAQGITRETMAEAVDLSPRYIGNIEDNNCMGSLKTISKLCEYLIAPMDYIVLGRDPIVESNTWDKTIKLLELIDIRYQPYIERLIYDMVRYLQQVDNDTNVEED